MGSLIWLMEKSKTGIGLKQGKNTKKKLMLVFPPSTLSSDDDDQLPIRVPCVC